MQHSASLDLGLQLHCGLNKQALEPAQSCSAQAVVLHSFNSAPACTELLAQLYSVSLLVALEVFPACSS